jgi:hypothetical protein
MRPTIAAIFLLWACSAALAQQPQRNPYVLDVDRAAYRLRAPHGGVSAAGGSSAPESRDSQHEMERQCAAWKHYAQQLESEFIRRGGSPLPPRPSRH